MQKQYLIAARHSRYREEISDTIDKFFGKWHWIERKKELVEMKLEKLKPEYIFFLHWSWKIPKRIYDRYRCVGFHMTDLPYGRGGSPLQNLILRGHEKTKLTAFRITEKMDSGSVYLKRNLSLEGRAEEILRRMAHIAANIMKDIIEKNPEPKVQQGPAVEFERRTPDQSEIPRGLETEELYDFIRMLDAEEYPKAFIRKKGYNVEFTHPEFQDDELCCKTRIGLQKGEN